MGVDENGVDELGSRQRGNQRTNGPVNAHLISGPTGHHLYKLCRA